MDLQREGFGFTETDLMPMRFFVVTHHVGGLVLGAYSEEGEGERLVGFLSSIPGTRNHFEYWHSYMLAVAADFRDKGVGSRLKFAQREFAIQRGIRLIEWTFDPLESKNAYFNIEKLGAIVRRYHPNFYGEGSGLQGALPTDRVVAEWWLDRRREPVGRPGSDVRRIPIPADIQLVKKLDIRAARNLQERVQQEFQKNLNEDFFAVSFRRKDEANEYIFVRGASGVYQTGI